MQIYIFNQFVNAGRGIISKKRPDLIKFFLTFHHFYSLTTVWERSTILVRIGIKAAASFYAGCFVAYI